MNLVKVKLFRGLGRDCSNVFIYLDLYLYTTYEDEVVVWSLRYVLFFATLWTVACQATLPWDFPGKNTGVGCHFLLQLNDIMRKQIYLKRWTQHRSAGQVSLTSECHLKKRNREVCVGRGRAWGRGEGNKEGRKKKRGQEKLDHSK